jgi:tRNA-splicing ligase RtcB
MRNMEQATVEQALLASRLPFISGHVSVMPDGHVGFGSTVGSVIPTRGAIIPGAVGVDIGCGMIATQTAYTANDLPDDLGVLLSSIEQGIPAGVGKGHENDRGILRGMPDIPSYFPAEMQRRAHTQFGSLGSGNHFVEVCLDEGSNVWTVLHSGSRGVGNLLAKQHIDEAKGLMKKYFINLPGDDLDLAYLVEGTPEFDAYIEDMLWAQKYAYQSRAEMNGVLLVALKLAIEGTRLGRTGIVKQTINCHHNYTERENHGGKNIWVTRKGAIKSDAGDLGVIPGSMGTDTYIVRGLGNPASYNSSSHGAGRKMSRAQARRDLDVESFKASMAGKTWQGGNADSLIDEDPRSYKSIKDVMEDQADLVEVVARLHQVLNYKGVDGSKKHR